MNDPRQFGQTFQEPMRSGRMRHNPSGASLHDSVYSGAGPAQGRQMSNSIPGGFGGFGGHRQTVARGSMRN